MEKRVPIKATSSSNIWRLIIYEQTKEANPGSTSYLQKRHTTQKGEDSVLTSFLLDLEESNRGVAQT